MHDGCAPPPSPCTPGARGAYRHVQAPLELDPEGAVQVLQLLLDPNASCRIATRVKSLCTAAAAPNAPFNPFRFITEELTLTPVTFAEAWLGNVIGWASQRWHGRNLGDGIAYSYRGVEYAVRQLVGNTVTHFVNGSRGFNKKAVCAPQPWAAAPRDGC